MKLRATSAVSCPQHGRSRLSVLKTAPSCAFTRAHAGEGGLSWGEWSPRALRLHSFFRRTGNERLLLFVSDGGAPAGVGGLGCRRRMALNDSVGPSDELQVELQEDVCLAAPRAQATEACSSPFTLSVCFRCCVFKNNYFRAIFWLRRWDHDQPLC